MSKQDLILYDSYIEIMRKTDIRVNARINKATRKFVGGLKTTSTPFNTLFDEFVIEAGFEEDLAVILRGSLTQQTAIGYGILPTVATSLIEQQSTVETLVEIFGKTNGNALSNQIYKTIEGSTQSVKTTLQKAHKDMIGFNKTVSQMQTALDKVTLKDEQLAGYMRRVEDAGKSIVNIDKRPIFDKYNAAVKRYNSDKTKENKKILDEATRDLNTFKRKQKEFDNAIAQANKQVENLKDNRSLKKTQRAQLKKAVSAVKKNNPDNFTRAITNSINAKYKSNMQRLVITENSRVFEQSKYNERFDNPLITAIKFTLSSSHSVVDQCDILASYNGFGLGRGVFPLGQQPRMPIHPNGVSYLISVTRSQAPEQKVKEGGSYNGSDYAKQGEKNNLSPSQVKELKNMEQMRKVTINSEKAIDIVTS